MTRDVTIDPFDIPLTTPLHTASGSIDRRRGFLLQVDGAYGEATPLPGWTESYEACRASLDAAADRLRGGASWDVALECCDGHPAARHAVDVARADTESATVGVPMAEYLTGEAAAATVPVNATIGDATIRDTASLARRAVTRGYECLKIKVGSRPVPGDVERLRAVRRAVGPDVELRADANGAWTPEQAREAMDAFADLHVSYVEQPLPADDLYGLADLRSETSTGVALDETLASHNVGDVLMVGAADVLILKPMSLGGVEPTHATASRASDLGVTPVVTTTIDAVVARTAALHVAASLDRPPACGLATADRLKFDLAVDPAPVQNGTMTVPDAPGLGVELAPIHDE